MELLTFTPRHWNDSDCWRHPATNETICWRHPKRSGHSFKDHRFFVNRTVYSDSFTNYLNYKPVWPFGYNSNPRIKEGWLPKCRCPKIKEPEPAPEHPHAQAVVLEVKTDPGRLTFKQHVLQYVIQLKARDDKDFIYEQMPNFRVWMVDTQKVLPWNLDRMIKNKKNKWWLDYLNDWMVFYNYKGLKQPGGLLKLRADANRELAQREKGRTMIPVEIKQRKHQLTMKDLFGQNEE